MKRKWMALLLSVLLCGCQSLPTGPVGKATESDELVLAIPVGSGSICYEAAQELARRAVDFAENTLTVTIVMEENIWDILEKGKADLVVCENSRLVRDGESLGNVRYPAVNADEEEQILQVTGDGAMFAMLEYPYFFRDGDCVLNGANDVDFLSALNYSLPEEFPMELKRLSYCGSYHWLVDDHEAWEAYFLENSIGDVLAERLSLGYSIRNVWESYNEGPLQLQEGDLTDAELDVSGKTVLLSGGYQQLLDIFMNPTLEAKLERSQLAALEEAIVYSGGYSRTLADNRLEQALNSLQVAGISIEDGDVERWYRAFQELYLSGEYEVNAELTKLLQEKTERFH